MMELFTAIRINCQDARELCAYAGKVLDSEIEHEDDLHITLQYIGKGADVNDVLCRFSAIAFAPFELGYGEIGTFTNMPECCNVIWQGINDPLGQLRNLYRLTKDSLTGIPIKENNPYTPHITLSYTREEINKEKICGLTSPLAGHTFSVKEFELCEVLKNDRKPHFRTIARFLLDESEKRESVQLVWINDFHGAICEGEKEPGTAKLVTAVKGYTEQNPHTAVLFGGDNFFGDPISGFYEGQPVAEMMKALNVKASVIGNHDFDLSDEALIECGKNGQFTFLSANIHSEKPAIGTDSLVLNVGGYSIGVIGLSTVEPLAGPDHPKCWDQYEIIDGLNISREYLQHCDCDVKVAATHYGLRETEDSVFIGNEALELISLENSFDAVLTAHFHQVLQFTKGKTAVLQAGCKGRCFGVLRFTFNEKRQLLSVLPLVYPVDSAAKPDAEIQKMISKYIDEGMKKLGVHVGYAAEDIPHRMPNFQIPVSGTALTKIATECMMGASGCQFAIIYAGRVGFSGFTKGPITLYDYQEQFSFKNYLVSMKLTGKQVRNILEAGFRTVDEGLPSPIAVNGLCVTLSPDNPYGSRVTHVSDAEGKALEDETEYTVVTENYLLTDPFGISVSCGKDILRLEQNVYDLVLNYIEEHSPILNIIPTNITIERRH